LLLIFVSLGIEVKEGIGKTGVVGILKRNPKPALVIALRSRPWMDYPVA
jgi:metal-dependent amidase/aminoacylase/carboxypeptidase family protein